MTFSKKFLSFIQKIEEYLNKNYFFLRMEKSNGIVGCNAVEKKTSNVVKEGKAEIDFPSSLNVFYNPVQEFNRDISVAVLRLLASDTAILKKHSKNSFKFQEKDFEVVENNSEILSVNETYPNGIRILEALAASGLRSVRYAKEVGGIKEIVANDVSEAAVECMINNLKHNGVENLIKPSQNDAALFMYENRKLDRRFTAIDLDPYGSPHTFLEGAVQSVTDGGMLLVTSTDMAVLCGNSPETCYLKYGALSLKHSACHEMALRLILQCIEANANKYGRYIVPLLSMSVDFYARVFVRIFTSQKKCKESFTKLSYVHCCKGCEATTFQRLGNIVKDGNSVKHQLSTPKVGPKCIHCNHSLVTAGPIWSEPIHDRKFVSRLKKSLKKDEFNTYKRMYGMLTMIEEELEDPPLYFVTDKLCSFLKMSNFKQQDYCSGLLNAGYKVSPTHARKNSIKTDAPISVVWDLMKHKKKIHTGSLDGLPEWHPARFILAKDIETKINFEKHPNSEFESLKQDVLRFQMNPKEYWGPKRKSKTGIDDEMQAKSKNSQGKRKAKRNDKNLKKVAIAKES